MIHNTYRSYILSNKNPQIFEKVKYLQNQLKLLTESNKERYYLLVSKKLKDSMTSAKTYWSILKVLLNNKKTPFIPPLFHGNKYVTDFKKKAEFFNCFFAKQCSIINNFSELPLNLCKKTDKFISTVTFANDDIVTLIQSLDPDKAHGHDMLSICMLNLCSKCICKLLDLTFQSCIKQMLFVSIKKVTSKF